MFRGLGSELTSSRCVQELSEICIKNESPLTAPNIKKIGTLFRSISTFNSTQELQFWFKLQDHVVLLEVLSQLQFYNIIQFTSYLYYNPHLVPELVESFGDVIWCQDEGVREDCAQTVAELLVVLVNLGPHTPREIHRPGHLLLSSVVQKFVARLLSASVQEPVPFLPLLLQSPKCVQSRLQVFCVSLLREMVQSTPEAVSLEDAVQNQAKLYTSGKTSPIIKEVFSQIFTNIVEEDLVKELSAVVTSSEKQFNWQWLLTAISVLAANITRTDLLKGAVDRWLMQGCSSRDSELLSSALLSARQCCAESPHKFGTYSSWFGGLQVRPAEAFNFFFQLLSQLVPHEPVLCLKIHVNKVPSAPANCHAVIADYAVLAKTRLSDLNQTTDYVGLFGEYTTTEQEGREADVAKVISYFKQSKEVMKTVLEASVFRRQFYEKVFLCELLKDYNPDYVEFIEKLYSIGKIPHGLYSRWCKMK